MQDSSVPANLALSPTKWKQGPHHPATELAPAIEILDLLVLLHIITDDEAWTTSPPLDPTKLLASTTSYDSEVEALGIISIRMAMNNDLPLRVDQKLCNTEGLPQLIIIPEFLSNVAEMDQR